MNGRYRIYLALALSVLVAGCANNQMRPAQFLCPIIGGAAAAGIAEAVSDGDDAYIPGAIGGALLGYLVCRNQPEPAPAPVVAAPTPPPAPPPPPPPAPPEVGTKLVSLDGTNFDFNKATLRADAITKLDNAAKVMNDNPSIKVNIEGHTDSVGSDAYNQGLSERRSSAVVSYLVSKGIDGSRLMSAGYGESRPVASNDTDEGRAQNRRVDLTVAE